VVLDAIVQPVRCGERTKESLPLEEVGVLLRQAEEGRAEAARELAGVLEPSGLGRLRDGTTRGGADRAETPVDR